MRDIITELREGNHYAFEDTFEKYYAPLCRYAYSIIRDMSDAEDVVQKVYFKLWNKREELFIQSSISSYLYRMVHNDSINYVREKTSHLEHNYNYISNFENEDNSTSQEVERSELRTTIDAAINSLPEQCRKVFEMSRLQQLSHNEIALRLNISNKTVENHISKALKLLRENLKNLLTVLIILLSK
jgi:RNA polymerase sigma-70 factor, ECF subfamily